MDRRYQDKFTDEEWSELFASEDGDAAHVDFQLHRISDESQGNVESSSGERLYKRKRKKSVEHSSAKKKKTVQQWLPEQYLVASNSKSSNWFLGVVVEASNENVEMKCMENTLLGKNMFKWPSTEKFVTFMNEQVWFAVDSPYPVNSRGGFALSAGDFGKVLKKL